MNPESSSRCYALVPCAGVGARAGGGVPKQYRQVGLRSVVGHTLAALAEVSRLAGTLVVVSATDALFEHHVPEGAGRGQWTARCGGVTRAESVSNGLRALAERGARPHDWVLVHDAARCLLRPQAVDRLIDACLGDPVGGLLALPVPDTLKRAAGDRVGSTVDREGLWAAQTPQMFRLQPLADALQAAARAGLPVTDEASAMEAAGHAPRLVPGDPDNIKITHPADFDLAERLLRDRR